MLALFLGERLHHAHARERLLQQRVDVALRPAFIEGRAAQPATEQRRPSSVDDTTISGARATDHTVSTGLMCHINHSMPTSVNIAWSGANSSASTTE
jgi:hypothetical protein